MPVPVPPIVLSRMTTPRRDTWSNAHVLLARIVALDSQPLQRDVMRKPGMALGLDRVHRHLPPDKCRSEMVT